MNPNNKIDFVAGSSSVAELERGTSLGTSFSLAVFAPGFSNLYAVAPLGRVDRYGSQLDITIAITPITTIVRPRVRRITAGLLLSAAEKVHDK